MTSKQMLTVAVLVLAAAPVWATPTASAPVDAAAKPAPSVAVEVSDEVTEEARDIQETIWFQGFVTDPGTGEPINGSVNVLARIYDAQFGGTSLWGPETHDPTQVTDGWFNIELGSIVSPLPAFDDPPYYLQLMIDGESLEPRMKLGSVPSAFQSLGSDDGGDDGDWITSGSNIYRATGNVGIGVTAPTSRIQIATPGETRAAYLFSEGAGSNTTMRALNTTGTAGAFSTGTDTQWFPLTPTAVYGRGDADGHGGFFESVGAGYGCIAQSHGSGPALWSHAGGTGRSGSFTGGEGVYIDASSLNSLEVTGDQPNTFSSVISAEYTSTSSNDADAIRGISMPTDYYGIGGYFEGGWKGAAAYCSGSGAGSYYGLYTSSTGGSGYNYGIWATAWGSGVSYAGYFSGNAHVTGTLSKGGGSFKIDHPLDPANKYLYHSFVESPDMMNVYNGNVELDGAGEAWIEMPDWFEALNRDFRYQLTCIGGFAPVYVAEKISGNRFKIAGGEPGMEVSWQVTGIRHDKYAEANRIPVEERKPAAELGKYIHPEAFDMPASMGVDYEKNTRVRK